MQLVQVQSLTLDTDAHDTCRYLFVPLWWKWETLRRCTLFFSVRAPTYEEAATQLFGDPVVEKAGDDEGQARREL